MIDRKFSIDEELEFYVDGLKISGWFESITDDVIRLKVFKDECFNSQMNDLIEINIKYLSNKFEQKLKNAYEEYKKLPKAEINKKSELYDNQWCVITGLGVVYPDPHRYYTFLEFVFWCGKDRTLYDRFLKN